MTNELALLILAALWLKTGRGVNLCLLILAYYAVFLVSVHLRSAPLDVTQSTNVYMVYIKQSAIDLTFLILCLYLSAKYQKMVGFYGLYAAIIASSLVCNGLMLFDQVVDIHRFYQWHKWRQEVAIPIDILFAVLGSGGVRISNYDNPYLRTGAGKRYNRRHCN
jgi:hypothetical protein